MTMMLTQESPGSRMYILLSRDHRVSRSFRATWHLRMLLTGQAWDTSSSDDMSVLSVVGGEGVSPATDVFYICQQYSLVFVLDITPTMIQVSNRTRQVKLNEAVATLTAILNLLTKPFQMAGNEDFLEPDLCVTVLAYCGGNPSASRKVLLQGIYLNSSNCDSITQSISDDIKALENNLSRGMLIFTDGVLGFSSPSNMHNAVNQMRGANTSCWMVQVGGGSEESAAFGLMPDSETLHFMSLACNGCVIQPDKVISASRVAPSGSLNVLQEAVLLWSFQLTAHTSRVGGVVGEGWGEGRGEEEEENFSPTIYRQFDKSTIHAPLFCVIGCRIRDGFFLKSVGIKDQDSILEVTMCYPWQASVNIYYTIQAPWPLSESSTALNTTIAYDGPYSFVHDVHCNLNQPITSYFRATAVRKFKQVLRSQSHSDTFLAHFLSFSATPTYHTLPQKITDGMPLFHLPPNQAKPVPAVGLSSSGDKKKKESALVNFWSPLCTIDTNLWYRWFHTDKIVLILDQDTYLPRNLLAPSANHRFASIQCRIAASKLFNYLKTWCSFVLLENQSFIRFLPTTESPRYFSLVRVAQKHPCVVLHVGHIEGTPHSLQSETLRELQKALLTLSVERVQLPKRSRSAAGGKGKTAKPCAFLVGKQLQRVMIRYDTSTMTGTLFQSASLSLAQPGVETERLVQNDYLTGTAWQWLVPHSLPTLLVALLRHRLREGFHIAHAQSGVVTLTAQLSVSQPHSTNHLAMILQYVVFPLTANPSASASFVISGGYPTCELWVEPQYGTVTQAPAGLQYLLGSTHTQIADKIHARDVELMLTVSSFVYLRHMCERGCHSLPRAPLEEDADRSCGGRSTMRIAYSVPRVVPVPFQVSRLLPKCRVIAFTLDAFPEVATERRVPSLQASPLNALFWKQLFEKLKELAPTEVPLTTPANTKPPSDTQAPSSSPPPPPSVPPLTERLVSSEQLADLCRLCDIGRDATDAGWRCFAMAPAEEENTVCLLLISNMFSREPTTKVVESCDKEEGRGGSVEEGDDVSAPSAMFYLPLLLLHCDQEIILDPDPAAPNPPSLLPDIFQRLRLENCNASLSPSSTQSPLPDATTSDPSTSLAKLYSSLASEALSALVSKLRALHFSSYLHALHITLTRRSPVPPSGFQAAVNICTRSILSIDCTPLIGALCRHSTIKPSPPRTDSSPPGRQDGIVEADVHSKQYLTSGSVDSGTFGRQYSASSTGADSHQSSGVMGDTISKQSSTSSNLETDTSSGKSITPSSLNRDTSSEQDFQFGPQMLEHLIRTVSNLSSLPSHPLTSSYRLHYIGQSGEELEEEEEEEEGESEQVPHCVQWEGEPQQLFQKYLSEAGFEDMPRCSGYYWLGRGEEDSVPQSSTQREKRHSREEVVVEGQGKEVEGGVEGAGSEGGAGDAFHSPPSEASTIKRKHSVTIDTTLRTAQSDHDSTSTGDDIDMAALSPLFSPSESHFLSPSRREPSLPTAPLFLHVACCIREHGGEDGGPSIPKQLPQIPVCLKSILFPGSSPSADTPASSASYSVSLELSFLSFSPEAVTQPPACSGEESSIDSTAQVLRHDLSSLPLEYQSRASSIRQKVEWLLTDVLISLSRECSPITPPLLQAMATHVHTSPHTSSCFTQHIPIKFVFGPQKSMIHLLTEVEAVQIPGYELEKCGEYYYLKHSTVATTTFQPSLPNTPDIDQPPQSSSSIFASLSAPRFIRSTTPDSGAPRLAPPGERGWGHRRSTSACVFSSVPPGSMRNSRRGSIGYPPPPSSCDHYPSPTSLAQADSSYDASRSSSCSELSVQPPDLAPVPLDTPPFWLALRVLQDEIQVYFQTRHSVPDLECCLATLRPLINQLGDRAREACHRTNQLLLLWDMLDTRQCSPLLLPESPSEAWVENVVHKRMPSLMEGGASGMEAFSPQQFQCALQWSKHITPHYRLKSMTMNIRKALQITRVALDAFAVTNRKDVYVFQDVQEDAAESIFYLKIDESLCRVDDTFEAEEPTIIPYDRSDTKATEAETLSTTSYHPSVSEQVGQDAERQSLAESLFDQPGKPRESLVLQLYGINKPSQSLLERLTHRIIFKLDDAALEIMCGLYARNQKLKLTPSDVHFLQPPGSNPSRQLRILVPSWVGEVHALFFYFLQSLSTLALKPKYSSLESHIQFQVPQSLQNACLTAGLSPEVHQDHLFLYIRPHTQGRGMAVFSVALTDSGGQLVPPQPSQVSPCEGGWNPANLERTHSVCTEGPEAVLEGDQEMPESDGYILRIDIWEKGNVGITDLSGKLHLSLKHALCDYLLELYFLPQPIARIDDMIPLDDSVIPNSPFVVLEPSVPELVGQDSNPVSPRRALFERGEIRVPSSLGLLPQQSSQDGGGGALSPDTPVQPEPHRSRCDTITVTHTMDDVLRSIQTAERRDSVAEQSEASVLTWQEKELNRRETEALDAYQREAHHGRQGVLENTYSSLIPQHLVETCKLSSRSVTHFNFPLLGSYSAEVFLNEILSFIGNLCEDLSLSTFKLGVSDVFSHYTSRKSSRPRTVAEVGEVKYVTVGRNLKQWDEARSPDVIEIRLTQPWIDPQTKQSLQLFHPLDSKKISKTVEYPLMSLAKERPCFIPRQRLLLLTISHNMAELWLYNLSEELAVQVRNRLDRLSKWQQMRVGFLHHLLAQKMGLFQHTHARDLREWTRAAAKHCSSIQDTVLLPSPVTAPSTPRQQRPQPIPALESLYLEMTPTGHTPQTMDPVYNHGHQVRESHSHFRKTYESKDLLGKVFSSWPSHSGSAAVPVDSSLIRQLKRLARLLHFCSARLLLSPAPAATSPDQSDQFDGVRNEFLSLYIQYLKMLDFEEITERATPPLTRHKGGGGGGGSGGHTPTRPSQQPPAHPFPPPPPPQQQQKFYKCMQRSWMHGIILVELTFVEERFDVKLLTLESSRLGEQKSLSPEVYGQFSTECARYKDLIHLNSFMHDFHLHLVLEMLGGGREIPEWLDMKGFLSQFVRESSLPAGAFNRNRLERGMVTVPLSGVKPAQLFHHILAHCSVFGLQALELRSLTGSGSRQQTAASEESVEDICLHIDVSSGENLSPATSPQLSKLLEDAQEGYAVHVLVTREVASPHCLGLAFYLLLVNINERFPRLTRDSSPLAPDTVAAVIATTSSTQSGGIFPSSGKPGQSSNESTSLRSQESELHVSMRKRRMKLGLDPLHCSTTSQLISDGRLVKEHMQGLQGHLEGIVKNAMHHMRRDELWKRMLYGRYRSDPSKPAVTQVSFEQLRCDEFRELLQLVTYRPLEKLDTRLTPLRKQTKKWFRRLMTMMEIRFSENIRVYKTDNDNYYFTVIINPDWSDMFVLAQSDRDSKSQGLYSVYRKSEEAGSTVPQEQRPITAHVEADRQHIENVVNFCCYFLWASMLDSSPPQPNVNLL